MNYFGTANRGGGGSFAITPSLYAVILAACVPVAQARGVEPEELASIASLTIHASWAEDGEVLKGLGFSLPEYVAEVADSAAAIAAAALRSPEIDFTSAKLGLFGEANTKA